MTKKIEESSPHTEQSNEEAPLVQPGTAQRLRLRSNLRAGYTPAPAPTGPRAPSPPPPPPSPKAILNF